MTQFQKKTLFYRSAVCKDLFTVCYLSMTVVLQRRNDVLTVCHVSAPKLIFVKFVVIDSLTSTCRIGLYYYVRTFIDEL